MGKRIFNKANTETLGRGFMALHALALYGKVKKYPTNKAGRPWDGLLALYSPQLALQAV